MEASKILVVTLVGALFSVPVATLAAAEAGKSPLDVHFIRASNYTSTVTVHFVLDGNTSCDTSKSKDCLFSDNCSEPTQDICTTTAVPLGTHKVEAIVDGQHLVAWVNLTLTAPTLGNVVAGECSVQEEDGKLNLSCL